MALNFPTSPTLNQEYTLGTKTWIWDGAAWTLKTATPNYLSLSGGTLTGNLGLGVTPAAWDTFTPVLELPGGASLLGVPEQTVLSNNFYYGGGASKRIATGGATQIAFGGSGSFYFQGAASGAANSAITWTTLMSINSAGDVSTYGALKQGNNQVLHAGNFTSYSPSLTGSGASGTWGISITGTAALEDSGVTSGSYTNATITVDAKGRVTSALSGSGGSTLTISTKTAAYTVVAGDAGKIIDCTSGTFTVSLTAAATLGAGFNCWVWNSNTTGTNAITIDPSGAETIDGATTLILRSGEGVQIICNGASWQTGGKKAMRGYAENLDSTVFKAVASGLNSVALGQDATASGTYAVAIHDSTASGNYSTAVGYYATAAANNSMALGNGTYTTGAYSTAIGLNSSNGGSQAVTGSGAMALGGSYASGTDSFAAAVANNTSSYGATGANSVAIGRLSKATGASAYAFGSSSTGNIASGNNSFARGVGCTASGVGAIAMGSTCVASGFGSVVLGSDGNDNGVQYRRVYGSNAGVQSSDLILWDDTTDATPTVISTNGNAAGISSATQLSLPNNSAYAFSGTIIARQQAAGGSNYAAWEIKGAILRDGTAASTVLGSVNINTLSKTAGATAWVVALTADTTNGGLAVTVTGAAATNIRWVATIQTSEVTYA